ncbi:MAG: tetratricopeptide repeat protein, partial [Pirellulales bacterium]
LTEESEWGWLVANYERFYRGTAYVDQMAVLNEHLRETPDDLDARFVRAYQYAFLGYGEAAVKDLDLLLAEAPEDLLARALLTRLGGTPPPLPEAEEGRVIPPAGQGGEFDSEVPFPLRRPA